MVQKFATENWGILNKWGFLGYKRIVFYWIKDRKMSKKNRFRPFEEAREFVRSLGFKVVKEWVMYSSSGQRPHDIPSNPNETYKDKGWVGMGDWLGNGKNVVSNKEFLPFKEAREFVRSLGIEKSEEWQEYSKSGQKPNDIPSNPGKIYKGNGWKGLGDWLGSGTIATSDRQFLPFEEAREFVRILNIKNSREWQEYSKSGQKPNDIPSNPGKIYKGKGWKGLGDWLGSGTIAPSDRQFLPFEEAIEFVRSLILKNKKEWRRYSSSGQKPHNIPSNPDVKYKGKGWKDWGDWLGNGNIAAINREYLPFEEAREFVRSLGLKSQKKWEEYSSSSQRPHNIPSRPDIVYKGKGWRGGQDFLEIVGNGNYNWTKGARLAYLEDITPFLHTCSTPQLFTIFEAIGLNRIIKEDKLRLIQKTAPNSKGRIEIISRIISDVIAIETDEIDAVKEESGELQEVMIPDNVSISKALDSIYDFQEEALAQIKFLESLENETITNSLDEEKIDYMISESINNLWYSVLNNSLDIKTLKSLVLKAEIPKRITGSFLKEYKKVVNIELPEDWIYPHAPLLMQKLITYRLSEKRRYGNWSSVGSGKTIGAVLAGRFVEAKNTLVITFNSTIGREDQRGWVKEIKSSFKNSNVYTKFDGKINLPSDSYNYLILNYETFQQKNSHEFIVDLLQRNTFDYVILDEVQNIKQRNFFESKRRGLIKSLLEAVEENNPDYYLLVMSATPVINNNFEGKSIIELIDPEGVKGLDIYENIGNCMELYRKFTKYGIRYKNHGENILKDDSYSLIDVKADSLYEIAKTIKQDDFLGQERLILDAKLKAIAPYVNTSLGKTIVYISYVYGIDEYVYDYLTRMGFKVGVYTGSKSKLNREEALNEFIDGELDILLASRPIGTGVDGLQKVSDRMIILSLPWTNAELIQLVGRINRKGSNFSSSGVDIIIPLVSITGEEGSFRWDYRKYNTITYKETIANAVVDGIIPDKLVKPKEILIKEATNAIPEFIEKLKNKIEEEVLEG